jgi:hypothetical protein
MKTKQNLTLDRPATYELTVPGAFDKRMSDWVPGMTLTVESNDEGLVITTLTCTVDQAALQGLIRRLYSLGLPIISVNFIGSENYYY